MRRRDEMTETIAALESEREDAKGGSGGASVSGVDDRGRSVALAELLRLVPLQTLAGPSDVVVRGVAVDSREVDPGFAFVAIRGAKTDGNRFIGDAVSRGAAVVVSELPPAELERSGVVWVQTPDARRAAGVFAARVAGEPAKAMNLVGITGTNGKTTTAFLVDGLVSRLAPPSLMLGTVVAKLGDRVTPTRHTTPEATIIHDFLAEGRAAGCRFGALEVSSHGLALHRLEGVEFEVAVFTNLSRDHLDFHRDMEAYFEAKRLLFARHLRAKGHAVVCIDDAYGERLASELASRSTTYGFSPTADLSVVDVTASLEGTRLTFRDALETRELRSPLLGRYNAVNLLAAFACARALGFEASEVLDALETVPGAPGRFESVDTGGLPFHVIVDYAHTDDALRKLLTAARPLTPGRLWVVFGCGGERDRAKRPLMGDVASRLADRVVITSDNPRGEDPEAILREIRLGARGEDVELEPDRRRAIELALQQAEAGDVVVIAGKGHEPYQIVGSRVLPFDDREVARSILAARARESAP